MRIDTGKVNLYYEKSGKGPPLILLHGNGEDHTIFTPLVKRLAAQFTVYTPDSRGHGMSSSAALDYAEMAEDFAEMIRRLDISRPVFCGFSDGGIIGLQLAINHPELLSKLIVCGANFTPAGLKPLCRLQMALSYLFSPKHDPKLRLMLTQPHIDAEKLNSVATPVLVLAGEHDLIRKRHTQKLASLLPHAVLQIIKGETHSSYVVDSGFLAPFICNF